MHVGRSWIRQNSVQNTRRELNSGESSYTNRPIYQQLALNSVLA